MPRIKNWDKLEGERLGPGWKNRETGSVFYFFNPAFAKSGFYRGIYKKEKSNGELTKGETVFETSEGKKSARKKAVKWMRNHPNA